MKSTYTKGTLLAAALTLLFAAHAWSSPADKTAQRARTKATFEERCARCHGLDGRGRTTTGEMLSTPDFTDAAWQKSATDERMLASVAEGRGEMPAFSRKLSRREIHALVAYVRAFAKPGR